MHLKFNGVNDSFRALVEGIHLGSIQTVNSSSRVGDVLQIPEPVILTYDKPLERVLFNQVRDCNPFFHVYEALWMLAGRNDIAPLDYYSSGYGKQVRDGDSYVANGAYGYRWRNSQIRFESLNDQGKYEADGHEVDQLDIIIDHLRRKPESRRVNLQMWNVEDDLLKIDSSKDVCCNLSCCFSIRKTADNEQFEDRSAFLDMTVFNRSNDLVWGSLGANFVHFTMLQEYVACCLGIEVGQYHQVSNNLHCYTERWTPEAWLADNSGSYIPAFRHVPLVQDRATFDAECRAFVTANAQTVTGCLSDDAWAERFLCATAQPMMNAFHCHKIREYGESLGWARSIEADDWRKAATSWLLKRKSNWEAKNVEH